VSKVPIVSPKDQLSGPLLDHLARRMRSEGEPELEAFGLRARHVITLTLLRNFGERSQSDLAETLGIDPTNLVALLNDLEGAQLVERRRSPQDRRRHTVTLTAAGSRRLAEIEGVLAVAEQRVLSALNSKEQATLYALLQRAAATTAASTHAPAVLPDFVGE
jgi:DNA-binding MarR family transcriptional regulator